MLDCFKPVGNNEWETPIDFFLRLDQEFHFTLDPCCTKETAKCSKYYTKEDNGLLKDWKGEVVYCNPPYGRDLGKWVKKCYEEYHKGATVVMLIPSRTDIAYFHDYIYNKCSEIRFLQGRLYFGGASNTCPFPCMVVVYKKSTFKEIDDILKSKCAECEKMGCCPKCVVNHTQNILPKLRSIGNVTIVQETLYLLIKSLNNEL